MKTQLASNQVLIERRHRRGQSRRESLQFQLQSAALRLKASVLVLADSRGRVVASSHKHPATTELAQLGPCLSDSKPWTGYIENAGTCHSVLVSPLRLSDGQMTYLCAMDAPKQRLGATLLHTAAGVRRIMTL